MACVAVGPLARSIDYENYSIADPYCRLATIIPKGSGEGFMVLVGGIPNIQFTSREEPDFVSKYFWQEFSDPQDDDPGDAEDKGKRS